MKRKVLLIILLITTVFLCSVSAQRTVELSDIVSESASPLILKADGIMIESFFQNYNSMQQVSNRTGFKFRYGFLDVFEVNAVYSYYSGHFKNGTAYEPATTFAIGYLEQVGFKIKLISSKSKHFEMAVLGNYKINNEILAFGYGKFNADELDINGVVLNHKYGELTFRNYLSKKVNLNYSVSYNYDYFIETSLGVTTNLFKNFYADIDIYNKFRVAETYIESYNYLRASVNYEILPSLFIQAATVGKFKRFYDYSQCYLFGLSWKVK